MTNPMIEQAIITPVIGWLVPLLKLPTNTDANAAILICKAPISAEALPACCVKGAKDSAVALG